MGKTICIVDDMLFMRKKLCQLAETAGYEVVGEGANGNEAVKLYREKQPHVLFLDITMPEKDGISALREIRAQDEQARIVIISALGQEDRVKEAIRAGAINFIVKPFQDEKILKLLNVL